MIAELTYRIRCQSDTQRHKCQADLKVRELQVLIQREVKYFQGHSLFVDRDKDFKDPDYDCFAMKYTSLSLSICVQNAEPL